MLTVDILTLFPQVFEGVLGESIVKRAQQKNLVQIRVVNIRDFTKDKHRKVDDRPFGGGPGMVMACQPIFDAVVYAKKRFKQTGHQSPVTSHQRKMKRRVILLSAGGERYTQKKARELAKADHLVLICGHYEGVDERVRQALVTDEISVGDYVLTGGEIPAMLVLDSVVRLIPRVLGDPESAELDSFEQGLLEHPHYTRPAAFRGRRVPRVLLSGDHAAVARWRQGMAVERTKGRRPDLLNPSKHEQD